MSALDVKTDMQPHEVVKEEFGTVLDTVNHVTQAEHELGFWKGVKLYPKAVFWSAFFCIAVIMAGFDPQLVSSFYALPAFQKKYGQLYEGEYIIPAAWQTGLGMGNAVGQLVGALACGWPLERFGRKRTLATCCCWSIAWIFMQFFSNNLTILCIGEIFAGLGYGFYVVIAPVYASDVCPLALRGVLTASVNLAFVIGQFIAQGTAAGVESRSDSLAYKLPFAIQWIWPVVLLIGLCFAPESPY
ncbi:putative maltose permease, partial [Aureobasidium melanogenum]